MNKFGKSLLALSLFGVITGTAQAEEKVLLPSPSQFWKDYAPHFRFLKSLPLCCAIY